MPGPLSGFAPRGPTRAWRQANVRRAERLPDDRDAGRGCVRLQAGFDMATLALGSEAVFFSATKATREDTAGRDARRAVEGREVGRAVCLVLKG